MEKIKICVLGGHNSMQRMINRNGFEFFELYDPDPFNISIPQWESEYINFINTIKPNFVICINIRHTNVKCNNWIKTLNVPNLKVVMWGLDSRRRVIQDHYNANMYYYCLDDDCKDPNVPFLPVYAQPRNVVDLEYRKYNLGIAYNKYGGFRDDEIKKVEHLLDFNDNTKFVEYSDVISNFKYGLNIASNYDGLPNYRTFEYAACGVYQLCSTRNKNILDELFDYGISYYDKIEDIPEIIKNIGDYDPYRIKEQVSNKHTLIQRIKEIMNFYFIDLTLIDDDKKE